MHRFNIIKVKHVVRQFWQAQGEIRLYLLNARHKLCIGGFKMSADLRHLIPRPQTRWSGIAKPSFDRPIKACDYLTFVVFGRIHTHRHQIGQRRRRLIERMTI